MYIIRLQTSDYYFGQTERCKHICMGPSTCPIPASPSDARRGDSMASRVLCGCGGMCQGTLKKLTPFCLKCSYNLQITALYNDTCCKLPDSTHISMYMMLKKDPCPIRSFIFCHIHSQNKSWTHWCLDTLALLAACPTPT